MNMYFKFLIFFIAFLSTPHIMAQVSLESSNLPIIVIDTHGQSIPDEYRIVADMGIIYNGDGQRNNVTDPFNNYQGKISIEIRGSSSQMFPKKQYALETQDDFGENRNVSLLGMPVENDWILYSPYSDKTLMRNVLIYGISNDMSRYASRTHFCELILNGDYRGVYVLMEKIKRDNNRVNISKLNSTEVSGDDLTGGYIVKIDKWDGEDNDGWVSPFPPYEGSASTIPYQYHYPKPSNIVPEQRQYIEDFITNFELIMSRWDYHDEEKGYSSLTDVYSFIDFFILNEISKNVDGYRLSTFYYKDKDSDDPLLHIGPIWDFNLAFGNADYYSGWKYIDWQVEINKLPAFEHDEFKMPFYWEKFINDRKFVRMIVDRWQALRSDILNIDSIKADIDATVNYLDEAQQRNFERWPILGVRIWPNYYVWDTYSDEVSFLKWWIEQRINWMDDILLDTDNPGSIGDLCVVDVSSSSIEISWSEVSDNKKISGYDVFLDNQMNRYSDGLGSVINQLDESTTYTIEVKARDYAGNYSQDNATIIVETLPFTAAEGIIVQAMLSAPIIDGIYDGIWDSISYTPLNNTIVGSAVNQNDLKADFKLGWDYENLYLYIRVIDNSLIHDSGSSLYEDDGVEIYIDSDNSKNETYGDNDFKYRLVYDDTTLYEKVHNAVDEVEYALRECESGYCVEMALPWKTIKGYGGNNQMIGFEVQINDDDDGGSRDTKIAWWGDSDIAYADPSAFGTIRLKGNPLGVKPKTDKIPVGFQLRQNFPNPFNPQTTIHFSLEKPAKVILDVYDNCGQKVQTLIHSHMNGGDHFCQFNGQGLSSGIYFYRLRADNGTQQVRRMILLR